MLQRSGLSQKSHVEAVDFGSGWVNPSLVSLLRGDFTNKNTHLYHHPTALRLNMVCSHVCLLGKPCCGTSGRLGSGRGA